MKIKLKNVLIITFTGLATLPLLLAGLFVGYHSYAFHKEQVYHQEAMICQNMASNLEAFFHRLEYHLEAISYFKNFNRLEPSEQQGIFTELLAKQNICRDLILLDSQGEIQVFVSNTGMLSSDIPASSLHSISDIWQKVMQAGTMQYGEVRFDTVTGEPLIYVALPVINLENGEIGSVIMADTKIKTIWDSLAQINLGEGEDVFVLDRENRVVAHRNPSIILRETFYSPPVEGTLGKGLSGRTSLVSTFQVSFNNLQLLVVKEISATAAFTPIINILKVLLLITFLAFVMALLLIVLATRVVISPIEALTSTVRAIKDGDLSARAIVPNQLEIGELALSFNEMTARLQGTLVRLEEEIVERKAQQEIVGKSERYNRMLFEETPLGLALCKMDGTLVDINPAYAKIIGRTIEETLPLSYWDITPEKYIPFEEAQLAQLQATGRYGPFEKEYIHKNGMLVPVVLTGLLIKQDGENYIWSVVEDMSIRQKVEQRLRLVSKAMESSLEGIVITDAKERIAEVNDAYCSITGYSREEVLGKTPRQMQSGYHNPEFYQEMWEAIISTGKWQGEIWDRRKNGEIFAKWLSISSLKDQNNQTTHYVGVFSDITRIKQTEEELRQLAHYDPLTGLANRALFTTLLGKKIDSSLRNSAPFAVVFLDLDRFKQVNDSLGHQAGDELLILVAERLEQCVRKSDVVSRLGGDEFTLILSEYKGEFNPEIICQRILESIALPVVIDEHTVFVSASLGIAIHPKDGATVEDLTKNADTAMYQAKEKGRNRYQFYDETMNARALERLELENELRHGIRAGQLCLYYQPKLDILQGRVSGCEALVRWIHPERGVIPPVKFIPIAEETGLVRDIGRFVTREACRQARIWSETAPELLPVSVNLSAGEFSDSDLLKEIKNVLEETGLDPSHLELELTESTVMDYSDQENMATLNQIQALGIRLSIDDFGTGYSSLSYLKNMSFDAIKIDRSFVKDITRDSNDEAIILAIISMAHNLNMEIIAEGVETLEQLEFLRSHHSEKIQGYLFSKPLPPVEVEARIESDEARAILQFLGNNSLS